MTLWESYPSASKYSAHISVTDFPKKNQEYKFWQRQKMKPESAKEASYNCVETASVNL